LTNIKPAVEKTAKNFGYSTFEITPLISGDKVWYNGEQIQFTFDSELLHWKFRFQLIENFLHLSYEPYFFQNEEEHLYFSDVYNFMFEEFKSIPEVRLFVQTGIIKPAPMGCVIRDALEYKKNVNNKLSIEEKSEILSLFNESFKDKAKENRHIHFCGKQSLKVVDFLLEKNICKLETEISPIEKSLSFIDTDFNNEFFTQKLSNKLYKFGYFSYSKQI
jgi:hypothetical protein